MDRQDSIRKIVGRWISQQNEVAQKLGMSASGLNKMLTGASLFPLPRFLQLVALLQPDQSDVDEAFRLYLADLDIPTSALRLIANGGGNSSPSIRARIHALVDQVPEEKLSVLEPILKMMVNE